MFYVSKVSPLFFILALLNIFTSLLLKVSGSEGIPFYILIVFGFLGSTLVGAMYQIIPNSQSRKPPLSFVSYVVFALSGLASPLFWIGSYTIASVLIFLAYGTFFFHTLASVKNWTPPTVKFLGASTLYLFLSSFLLMLSMSFGYVSLQAAVHTLTVGALLNAVYGVEIAWIPMLLMSALSFRSMKRLFLAKQASTAVVVLAFMSMHYHVIALASLLELGVSLYYLYMNYSLLKNRNAPSPVPYVVRIFLVALLFLPLGIIVGGALASHPRVIPYLLDLHIDLLVYGFAAFTIFGGMFHLLPRIIWNWKFASSREAPTIGELVDEKAFPRFLVVSVIFLLLFIAMDLMPETLGRYSAFVYAVIILFFVKISFFHVINKLRGA